ncbi:FAD-dependent oxidoreductase [Catellatospora sp. KI3]|uniref:FAD-dependent oxidoreductase n=1 Tax=Catellatospora sp. KI3 TaxID=3041620 RepID=UPI002482698E|nr:FAD-dependent oxidoreductase [Catellatospora sp. KI3]MDI1465186.1 FAD-dependent oxidoreductase [Catellatospora sp. KI3]
MVIPVKADVIIVGAGVSGLTTGVCLAEAGLSVRVLTHQALSDRTSFAAGASWGPYMLADARAFEWSRVTREILEKLATAADGRGIRIVPGIDAAEAAGVEPPDWAAAMPGFRLCRPDELPDRFRSGWHYEVPLVDMPTYLAYLQDRLLAAGATLEQQRIESFAEVGGLCQVVVNCAGIGARELVPDLSLQGVLGQLVVVKNPDPPVVRFFQDDAEHGDLTYILPHGDLVVLGGCAVAEGTSLDRDAVAEQIKSRCAQIEPQLATAQIVEVRTGMRPVRPRIRVERVDVDGQAIVHNYGHGGSGLTVSWGCALEAARLVRGALDRSRVEG